MSARACCGGLALGLVAVAVGSVPLGLGAAIVFSLAVPVGGTASRPPGRRRRAVVYTVALAAVGLGAAGAFALGNTDLGEGLGGLYVLGFVAFTWLANLFSR